MPGHTHEFELRFTSIMYVYILALCLEFLELSELVILHDWYNDLWMLNIAIVQEYYRLVQCTPYRRYGSFVLYKLHWCSVCSCSCRARICCAIFSVAVRAAIFFPLTSLHRQHCRYPERCAFFCGISLSRRWKI